MLAAFGTVTGADIASQRALRALISLELQQRVAAFEAARRALDEQIARWPPLGAFVVADTSIYIEHDDKLEALDLAGLIDAEDELAPVHLLVLIVVVDELDGLKNKADKPHKRWRAGYTLGVFDRIFPKGNGAGGGSSRSRPRTRRNSCWMPATLFPVCTSPIDASGDETSRKKQFEDLSKVEGLVQLARRIITVFVWLLFGASTLLTTLGLSGSVSQPIAIRVILYILTFLFAIPAALQLADFTRKADPPIIDRLAKGIAFRILRHRQTQFITMYGRQEMAKEVWPLQADNFLVKHQMEIRRRRWKRYSVGIAVIVVAATAWQLKLHVFSPSGGSLIHASVGKKFNIDNTFAITVLDAPRCSSNKCSVDIRFRNISGYTAHIGSDAFINREDSAGTTLCDPYPPLDCVSDSYGTYYYIISLIGDGIHYDLSADTTFNVPQFPPTHTVQEKFTFTVPPPRIPIGELELTGISKEAVVSFSNS